MQSMSNTKIELLQFDVSTNKGEKCYHLNVCGTGIS